MQREPTHNTGLDLQREQAEQSNKDWQFGAVSQPCLVSIPEDQREYYLPPGELQNIGEEKMDCASRAPLNILEAKFTYAYNNNKFSPANMKWLAQNGYIDFDEEGHRFISFSDAFVAINSGTTRQGNSLKAPLDAIRKKGLVPKLMLPQASTFDAHHDPARITPQIEYRGAEFAKRFQINYEQVKDIHMSDALKDDYLNVAGYAWPDPVDGEYPRTELQPNHAFALFKTPSYYAFDNYLDRDGDFVKKLTPDYDLWDYGYRIYISKENPVVPTRFWLFEILRRLFS